MKYYSMADLNFSIEGIDNCVDSLIKMADYEISKPSNIDVCVNFVKEDFIPIPTDVEVIARMLARVYIKSDDGYGIYTVLDEADGALVYIQFDKTFTNVLVRQSSNDQLPIEQEAKAYNVLWEIFKNVIVCFDGIIIHSSAISYAGEGVIFSAPSGTGKSTHTRLWQKMFVQSVILVNDDTPAIRRIDDKLYLYGLPWSGSGSNCSVRVPLKAIAFLERGTQNNLYPIDVITALYNLTDEMYRPIYSEIMDRQLSLVDFIFEKIPILTIECNMQDEAAIVAKDYIFKRL